MLLAHLSHLHPGRKTPPNGAERLHSLRQALASLAAHNPVAILIAGDTFDGPHLEQPLVEEAAQCFSSATNDRGEPIPVVLIPGNHDPSDADRLWTAFRKALAPACDLRLVLRAQAIELADGDLIVEAYPCPTRYSAEPPWEPRLSVSARPGSFRVILAHGTLQGGPVPDGESDAYPFTQADVEALGAD